MDDERDGWALQVAAAFHYWYEVLAVEHGWQTQERTRTDWSDLPPENQATMLETVKRVFDYSGNLWIEMGDCAHRNVPLYSLRPTALKSELIDG